MNIADPIAPSADSHPLSVYWICPPTRNGEERLRHATIQAPGALVQGAKISSVARCSITVPLATPNDRVPSSRLVARCCERCVEAVADIRKARTVRDVFWDF